MESQKSNVNDEIIQPPDQSETGAEIETQQEQNSDTLPRDEQPGPSPKQDDISWSKNSGQFIDIDRICYPSRDGTYLSQLYNQPLTTTLSSFSHVASIVRNPYEFINNVDELVKQARFRSRDNVVQRHQSRLSGDLPRVLNQNNQSPIPSSPVLREMDTFINYNNQSLTSQSDEANENPICSFPVPALPPIECSHKRGRLPPLTIEEYQTMYENSVSDLELLERVFYGGISNCQLRAALWPYLFGIVEHRGVFEKITSPTGQEVYLFVDHEANTTKWVELRNLYHTYYKQWKSILPDQETRFSSFREKKSLIERDVIRCDRLHPFYIESKNLSILTEVLMTYVMYDFDIGYVQGMSDLAGPILYLFRGDAVKTFWVFVEVMKLFRRNFESLQKTITFQLECLSRLVQHTDPIFAEYLAKNESLNCFFAFRAIVCQFKRELMKEDECDYSQVLYLWDTIWSVNRMNFLRNKQKKDVDNGTDPSEDKESSTTKKDGQSKKGQFIHVCDPNLADSPRHSLFETEIFVLALCLSMIRRERDLIMAQNLDATDIHLHFINPKLSNNLNDFIEHAINIYSYLKNEFDLTKLVRPMENQETTKDDNPVSAVESPEDYDLCSDFLMISGASGT